ncbi:putative signal transducing protein [Parasediminibacterium sp. JCM 36343]|uniref:putative signal transducing protein n=1 Tax=Parasediminibacterium sp. JCM 36343 TaxID=3374279 RepID=UPI00397B89E4
MKEWHLLLKTRSYTEASIVQGMLEENHIPVQVLNKLDSSYLNFGDIEVYVPVTLKEMAKALLDKALLN